jgi:hypothetical protein
MGWSDVTQTRANNYDGLIKFFEAHIYDPPGPGIPRYAAVSEEFFDDQRVGAKVGLYDTEQDAFEFLGESVLEGYAPDGVYDLDTTEKIYVQVSTPIVTRGKDRGFNPLAE